MDQDDEAGQPADALAAEEVTVEVAAPAATDALVERWWADLFPGSPVGQLTEAWNHAFAAKEELKRRLNELAK